MWLKGRLLTKGKTTGNKRESETKPAAEPQKTLRSNRKLQTKKKGRLDTEDETPGGGTQKASQEDLNAHGLCPQKRTFAARTLLARNELRKNAGRNIESKEKKKPAA